MSKRRKQLFALIAAVALALAPIAQVGAAGEQMSVNVDVLNLRQAATTGASVLAKLRRNQVVTVIETLSSGWSQVSVGANTGYVMTRYLQEVSAASLSGVFNAQVPKSGGSADMDVVSELYTPTYTKMLMDMGYKPGQKVLMKYGDKSYTLVVPNSSSEPPLVLNNTSHSASTEAAIGSSSNIVYGDSGEKVEELQKGLSMLGFYQHEATGTFDDNTRNALIQMQLYYGYAVTGWVDISLYESITGNVEKPENIDVSALPPKPYGDGAEMVSWSTVNNLWKRGTNATVIDVLTGAQFTAKRWAGSEHADVEPLTAADTAIMKAAYGGTWSWSRRAVVVIINGRHIAGSMNGMPHGFETLYDNDFVGQFCIHFLDSKVHASSKVDPDHQKMIRYAAGL